MMLRQWAKSVILMLGSCMIGCSPESATVAHLPSPSLAPPALTDSVMGNLAPVARHIVVALRDPAARGVIARALRSQTTSRLGLDLQSCSSSASIKSILAAGERRGAGAASAICSLVQRLDGAVLYMDPNRLAAWDTTVAPMVGAIAHPERGLPRQFSAYRSATRITALPRDGSLAGPILMVLPYRHPSYGGRSREGDQETRIIAVPNPAIAKGVPLPTISSTRP